MQGFGLFGSAAPRMMQPSTERRRRRVTAQDALLFGDPAPAPASNTPPQGMIGAGAPVDRKKIVPMAGEPSGYTPGKRDFMGEVMKDPLFAFFNGTDGLNARREEGIMSDYARQSAEQSAAQRQARIEQANALGMKGREAALFVDANEDYYKNYAENMKPTTLSKGQRLVNGAGTDIFNPDTGVSEGQAWQTDETGKTLWGQRQATTPEEINAAAITAETARNNNMVNSLGRDRLALDAEKATGTPTPENIGTMRKEWNSQASEFRGVRDAYSRVQASGDGTTPAQQMSMIFAYMKMLDPTSAVRETEYANAENARGVPTAVQNIWNKVVDGQFLAPSQIADFKNQAKSLYQNAETDYGRSFKFYQDQAVGAGMSPDVIQDFRISPENVAPQAPPSATITAPNGQQFTREKSVAVQNFMKSLPKSMQDPQFMAQLDNLLGQSSSPGQQMGAPPAGVSREEWNAMTPEEKALFQ